MTTKMSKCLRNSSYSSKGSSKVKIEIMCAILKKKKQNSGRNQHTTILQEISRQNHSLTVKQNKEKHWLKLTKSK